MKSYRRSVVLILIPALLFASSYSAAVAPVRARPLVRRPAWLNPCQPTGVDAPALCGKYEVFENRKTKSGRKIGLNIVVLPALDSEPASDPVFWLHGGPGAAATQTVPAARQGFLRLLREHRDLIFVDQRGTGESNGLRCDIGDDPSDPKTFFGDLFPLGLVRQCRKKLESVADLKLYTTPIAMDDLDEVRAALGYDKINLVAASYGTIAALVYMRQHQDHLRAVFLAGVANTNIRQPLLFPAAAQHALDLLLQDCAADDICHQHFPDLKREFQSVLASFATGAVTANVRPPSSSETQTVQITRGNFVERIRLLLYTTTFARFVPLIIHRAFENDYAPFAELAAGYNPGAIVARGMYFTVTCSEGVPFITENDVRQTRRTFVGEYRVRSHMEACKLWPRADIPRSYLGPVASKVPVLMISGELDGSTPPWLGAEAIVHMPNARQVKIRYYGHQVDSPCVWKLLADFIDTGSGAGLDTTCTEAIRRPPFATELAPR